MRQHMWMTIILIASNEFNISQADGHCIRMITPDFFCLSVWGSPESLGIFVLSP
jgi:hypothetical protein